MIIIQDTREKQPYSFSSHGEYEVVVRKLDTGDYSIEGYEDIFTIDRKGTVVEIANNLSVDYKRFQKELVRLSKIKYAYILLEFSIDDLLKYPKDCKIPFYKMKYVKRKGPELLKQIETIMDKYGVEFIFCDNRYEAEIRTIQLIQEVISNEKVVR